MNWRLKFQGFLTYGVAVARGKALAVIMLAAAPAWAEEVTVLALGDSLTQGYGLPEAEGFDLLSDTARKTRVDHVLSNAFGFGGVNAALVFSRPG